MMTELSVPFIKSLGELPGIDADALARALTQTPPGIGYRLNVRKSAATDGANSLYPDSQPACDLLMNHRRRILHIESTRMQKRIEGKHRSLRKRRSTLTPFDRLTIRI